MKKQSQPHRLISEQFKHSNYQLAEKIGEGGFGQVYRAIQVNTGQSVAIKFIVIDGHYDDTTRQRYIDRFNRETLLCSRLQHPNIVRLLDKGSAGELLYAVFEYVNGLTLKDTLAGQGRLLPAAAAQVMAQVLEALAHAHAQGVIHRDIKPANIMLEKFGTTLHVKVLDFGIGTLVQEARQLNHKTLTLTSETLGTPAYSAPEQLRGEPATTKTDIYVWGLVLLECLTGKPAIKGNSLAGIFHNQLSAANVPLPAAIAGHSVTSLLRRVLKKNHTERAANAELIHAEFLQHNFAVLVGDLSETVSMTRSIQMQSSDVTQTQLTQMTQQSQITNADTHLTEYRQLTALCITLRSSCHNDTKAEVDIAETILNDQMAQCIDIAVSYGGFHVGTLAGSALFYFGFPMSSDNDCRLAARTALEIKSVLNRRDLLRRNTQNVDLVARIGIHTGMATIYSDNVPQGDTSQVASELSNQAKSGQILLSAASQALLVTHLDVEPLKQWVTNSAQQQLPLFSMLGERSVEAFGFLRANKSHHQLIGREEPLKQLSEIVDLQANTRFVHLFGEAGIGKSRLVYEFRTMAVEHHHFVAQCLPEHQNYALYPILQVIKRKYLFDLNDDEVTAKRITAILHNLPQINVDETIAILFAWLSLPIADEPALVVQDLAAQKSILFNALIGLLLHTDEQQNLAQDRPFLFLFEDIHWADDTTIEFIDGLRVSDVFTQSGGAIISTSRQAAPVQWRFNTENSAGKSTAVIELKKLSVEHTEQFVELLFEHNALSSRLLTLITQRADGIPLFIEELVEMVKNQKLVSMVNGFVDFVTDKGMEKVPESLRQSLQYKLDGLVYAKETVQLAACIGREFDYQLLVATSTESESDVQNDLNELVEAQLVYIQRKTYGDSYIFKHALVRDAAYDSLTTQRVKDNHRLIAQSLSLLNDGKHSDELPIIADHYRLAGDDNQACDYYQQAAEQSAQVSNAQLAISFFNQAIESLKRLSVGQSNAQPPAQSPGQPNELDSPSYDLRELKIRSALGVVYCSIYGYASEIVTDNQEVINQIAQQYHQPTETFQGMWVDGVTQLVQARYESAAKAIDPLVELAEEQQDLALIFPAYVLKVGWHWHTGDFPVAKQLAQKVLSQYDFDQHNYLAPHYTYDPGIAIMCEHTSVLSAMGETEAAQHYRELALSLSRRCADPSNLAHTLVRSSLAATIANEYENSLIWAQDALQVAEQHGLDLWQAMARIQCGWAMSFTNNESVNLGDIEAAFEDLKNTGSVAHSAWYQTLIAQVYANQHDVTRAINAVDEAIKSAEHTDDALFLVGSYIVKIQTLLMSHGEQSADSSTHSLSVAMTDQLSEIIHKLKQLMIKQQSFGFVTRLQQLVQDERMLQPPFQPFAKLLSELIDDKDTFR